jgi:hypothetical protein
LDMDPDPHPGSGFSNSECHIFNEKVQILFDFCISLNNNNSKHMKKYYFEHPTFQFFAIFSRDSKSAVIFWFILILNFASGCKLCMQACREWQKNQNTHFYKREKDQNCASITIVTMRSSRAVRASGYCNA